jgi:hypothetical protein
MEIEITAKSRSSLIRRITCLMTRFNSLLSARGRQDRKKASRELKGLPFIGPPEIGIGAKIARLPLALMFPATVFAAPTIRSLFQMSSVQ